MKEVRNAIADYLLSLSEITSQLGTFKSVPAVFNSSPVPPAATGRYVVIRDAVTDGPFETKDPQDAPTDMIITRGREVVHDVAVYQDQTGDGSELEAVATLIRKRLNRHLLTISGYTTLIARAYGPINAPGSEEMDNQVDGRIVTVALTVIENP